MKRFPTNLFVVLPLGGATLVALVAIGIASAGQTSAVLRSSTFDSNSENWSGTWQADGGNPGGYLTAPVAGNGWSGWTSGHYHWWGNVLDGYGGKLEFDLAGPSADKARVYLATLNSSVRHACGDLSGLATTASWTTYSINLRPSGFRRCDYGNPGKRLTRAQMAAMLAGLDHIHVTVHDDALGSYIGLDNVSISAPDSAVTAPAGTVARQLFMERKPHKWRGTLTARDDYSCAGHMKITIFRQAKRPVKVATATTTEVDITPGWASFSVGHKGLRAGAYYARVETKKSLLDGNTCKATRSMIIRVR